MSAQGAIRPKDFVPQEGGKRVCVYARAHTQALLHTYPEKDRD